MLDVDAEGKTLFDIWDTRSHLRQSLGIAGDSQPSCSQAQHQVQGGRTVAVLHGRPNLRSRAHKTRCLPRRFVPKADAGPGRGEGTPPVRPLSSSWGP